MVKYWRVTAEESMTEHYCTTLSYVTDTLSFVKYLIDHIFVTNVTNRVWGGCLVTNLSQKNKNNHFSKAFSKHLEASPTCPFLNMDHPLPETSLSSTSKAL